LGQSWKPLKMLGRKKIKQSFAQLRENERRLYTKKRNQKRVKQHQKARKAFVVQRAEKKMEYRREFDRIQNSITDYLEGEVVLPDFLKRDPKVPFSDEDITKQDIEWLEKYAPASDQTLMSEEKEEDDEDDDDDDDEFRDDFRDEPDNKEYDLASPRWPNERAGDLKQFKIMSNNQRDRALRKELLRFRFDLVPPAAKRLRTTITTETTTLNLPSPNFDAPPVTVARRKLFDPERPALLLKTATKLKLGLKTKQVINMQLSFQHPLLFVHQEYPLYVGSKLHDPLIVRKLLLRVFVPALKLPPLVRKRLVKLVGPRYKSGVLTLISRSKPNLAANKNHAIKTLKLLLSEAYKADLNYIPFDIPWLPHQQIEKEIREETEYKKRMQTQSLDNYKQLNHHIYFLYPNPMVTSTDEIEHGKKRMQKVREELRLKSIFHKTKVLKFALKKEL